MTPNTHTSTLLLRQPNASRDHVVFVYASDLWVAGRDGSHPRRLTVHAGIKAMPFFSPDGAWIAYSAGSYNRDISVYVIPVQGGSPTKLTFHPGHDWVQGWTSDGEKILFSSASDSASPRYTRFFTIARTGGYPEALALPMANRGSYSPDGSRLAYTRIPEPFTTWKRYRGGQTQPIWLIDLQSHEIEAIDCPNVNDAYPCWLGDTVYFLSDRNHTMNLFAYDIHTKDVRQVTHHEEFDVKYASVGGGVISYEQGGRLHIFDPASESSQPLDIQIVADLPQTRPYYQRVTHFIRSAHLSPSGARAVFEARGEILTVPAKKGAIRNVTQTPGVHERNPAWSPDGKRIAYFSDSSGEYHLILRDQMGLEEPRMIDLGGAGSGEESDGATFYYSPKWSPDGNKILYTDKRLNIFYIDVNPVANPADNPTGNPPTSKPVKVDSDTYDHPSRSLDPVWSPDSRWIAYTKRLPSHLRAVFLHDLASGQSHQITDGLSDATSACFSLDGKYLFFAASVDYALNTGWLDLSSHNRPVKHTIYVVVLSKETRSPFFPESDEEGEEKSGEEKGKENNKENNKENGKEEKEEKKPDEKKADEKQPDEKKPDEKKSDDENPPVAEANETGEKKEEKKENNEDEKKEEKKEDKKDGKKGPEPIKVRIDLENIDQRILALPLPARYYYSLQAAAKGKLFYLESAPNVDGDWLQCFDFKERKSELFLDKIYSYWMNYNGEKLLYRAVGNSYAIVETKEKPKPDPDRLNLDKLEVYVDPRAEWAQMFDEVGRIQRDYFYDAGMHGADWPAICAKYRAFLPHVGHRDDLNALFAEMMGELVAGHAYVGGGEMESVDYLAVGLLGADYRVVDGYYQITRIYQGQNWHPELRSPLTEPGVNISVGDTILAVNGRPLRAPTSIYQLFERTADRVTLLRVNSTPSEQGARNVNVVPIASESALRHWDWVEGNRRKVHEMSNGRVAYVYLPDTGTGGYSAFNRYYFAQLDRQAVIIDERFNGGGYVADYVIDLLGRPLLSYWATREGNIFTTPNASIFGPKAMIINEYAASGGDALPQFFRRRQLGKIIGKRTWGGLIGIYDYPVLMDGGFVTAPRLAIFSPDGQWEVENEGVAPDIEVEMTPKEVIAGHDPQLEKAIEWVLAELAANPRPVMQRPPSANRVAKV